MYYFLKILKSIDDATTTIIAGIAVHITTDNPNNSAVNVTFFINGYLFVYDIVGHLWIKRHIHPIIMIFAV